MYTVYTYELCSVQEVVHTTLIYPQIFFTYFLQKNIIQLCIAHVEFGSCNGQRVLSVVHRFIQIIRKTLLGYFSES